MQDQENIHFITGDAREDKVLEQAQIDRAKHLITALPDDIDN